MFNTGLKNTDNITLFNITILKNENTFNTNIENIKSPKSKYKFILNVLNILNMFSKKRLYKLIEYYKLLICYVYLNSDLENNERRLFYDKRIEQNKSVFNQYISWLNDIKFDYFSIIPKDKVNYFILKIDKSFENEIKEFIKINEIDSNEKLLKLLEIYINISNN